jgi:hypothetical protein
VERADGQIDAILADGRRVTVKRQARIRPDRENAQLLRIDQAFVSHRYCAVSLDVAAGECDRALKRRNFAADLEAADDIVRNGAKSDQGDPRERRSSLTYHGRGIAFVERNINIRPPIKPTLCQVGCGLPRLQPAMRLPGPSRFY